MISWCCKNICFVSKFFSRKPFYNFFHFFKKVSKNETRRLRFIWTKKKIGCGGKWRRRRLGKVGDDKNDCLRWQHDWAFLQFLKREGWSNQMQAYVGLLWNRVFPKLLNWDFEFRGLLLIKINNWKLRRLNFCYSPCFFFFAVLLSPVLDGFEWLLSSNDTVLAVIKSWQHQLNPSGNYWERRESNPGSWDRKPVC